MSHNNELKQCVLSMQPISRAVRETLKRRPWSEEMTARLTKANRFIVKCAAHDLHDHIVRIVGRDDDFCVGPLPNSVLVHVAGMVVKIDSRFLHPLPDTPPMACAL